MSDEWFVDDEGFKRDKDGVISYDDFKLKIVFADTIEDFAKLRDMLEEDSVYGCMELSSMLTEKEDIFQEERLLEYL